jgi:hypothetical protein
MKKCVNICGWVYYTCIHIEIKQQNGKLRRAVALVIRRAVALAIRRALVIRRALAIRRAVALAIRRTVASTTIKKIYFGYISIFVYLGKCSLHKKSKNLQTTQTTKPKHAQRLSQSQIQGWFWQKKGQGPNY